MLQGKEVWLVKLKGVDTPEAAEAFKAQRLMMAASDRPVLEDDEEFYVQELVGMQVTLPTLSYSLLSILSCLLSPEQHECIWLCDSPEFGDACAGHHAGDGPGCRDCG